MVDVILGYEPSHKFGWIELDKDKYNGETYYNDKLIVKVHQLLWEKIKNIIKIKLRGFDSLILIDGPRRGGKSTIGKTIAYILNPDLNINNFVKGIEDSPEKIEAAKEGDVLIFDEGSLVASSKDGMAKRNKQLLKIIDVCGVKKLTLIFCMPVFFQISRPIASTHSRFLIHVYLKEDLQRGQFAYFGTKKKQLLYDVGKKNNESYRYPPSDFTGKFYDFRLPFEDQYDKLKKESLMEALDIKPKEKAIDFKTIRDKLVIDFLKNNPDLSQEKVAQGFGITRRTIYNINKAHEKEMLKKSSEKGENGGNYNI